MDENMGTEMVSRYLSNERVKNLANEDKISDSARHYVNLLFQSMEVEKLKEMAYLELRENEKIEVQQLLKHTFESSLPVYLPVTEVSQILGVSPQMVRRYCAEGKIKAKQRLGETGQWLIPTEQFVSKPEFTKYLYQKEINRKKSIKAAEIMLQMIDEDEEE
ncbi:helix-turn-helix domain-containing protein [Lederbergia panacisoli]|uniref:helix-turn-helix domain-containing protein n=1 Tax=Lederbergia panacisoli TaxID=1255251 RepID=UPI00214ACED0|nr:helix-turn-helix domain-containing protein [Lederbergia panacisoli]MCR2822369.1 helix-turn-helix domain-containing protein [Lederbergia panacisoli]